ncbi:MAG: hypothetical protein ACRDNS_23660 [Trebonia sp.]
MFNRETVIGLLLRKPGAPHSLIARLAVLALAATGAAFLVWSAVIHLELWSDGYKDISVIGPLFLMQAIVCIVLAVAIVAFRWLVLLVAGAVFGVATAVGLLLSVYVGLFGYTESLSVPYSELSLAVEFTAAFVLLVSAGLLALTAPVRAATGPAPVPSGLR